MALDDMKKLRRILIIDGSRVVRATLTKHLREDFDVLEEGDGISAWQTLMLDSSISAVISGINPPKLEAHDLLARMRASSKQRLREIPFLLIVSDVDDETAREVDRARGVAGFITKTMKKSALVECLNSFLEQPAAQKEVIAPEVQKVPEAQKEQKEISPTKEEAPKPAVQVQAPQVPQALQLPEKLLESKKFRTVLSALNFKDSNTGPICSLVFGIDNREALIARFGEDVSGLISARFASLLVAKLSPRDLIGRCRGERLAIVSHGVDLKDGMRFGARVCKSLASGQIAIRGQKVKLTASVGVASTSDDDVASGGELFLLADQRLDQALVCGGNTVSVEFRPGCPMHCRERGALQQLEALSAAKDLDLAEQIGSIGLKMLPLLQVMNKELSLGLPLAEIERLLHERAVAEVETA